MSAVQTYIINQVYTMNPGDKRLGDKRPGDKHKIKNSSKRKRGENKTPDELRLEDLEEEFKKTEKKIKHLQTVNNFKKIMAKDNNDQMDIAKTNDDDYGINMKDTLLSDDEDIRNNPDFDEALKDNIDYENIFNEKKNGGKNKRKSHKNKSHKRKSHKRKSYKRSKH